MILVTLGTHPSPMDRLVVAMDDLLGRAVVTEPVIIQAAAFGVRPRLATEASIVSYEQLARWIGEARVVVCHGGPGTILEVLSAGKIPRVVPRDPQLGEHVDGHQQQFVRWLAGRRPIVPIWDVSNLGEALRDLEPPARSATPSSTSPVRRLIEIVEGRTGPE